MKRLVLEKWMNVFRIALLLAVWPIWMNAGIITTTVKDNVPVKHGTITVTTQTWDKLDVAPSGLPNIIVEVTPVPGFVTKTIKGPNTITASDNKGIFLDITYSEYMSFDAEIVPKLVTDAQTLADILNEYEPNSSIADGNTVQINKRIWYSKSDPIIISPEASIELQMNEYLYYEPFILDGGDLFVSPGKGNIHTFEVNSGNLTLQGNGNITNLKMNGGHLKIEKVESRTSVSTLTINGDVSIEGDAIFSCDEPNKIPTLCNDLEIQSGTVSLKNLEIGYTVVKDGIVNIENVHTNIYVGSDRTPEACLLQEGGTVNISGNSKFGIRSTSPDVNIIKVKSGQLNVAGGQLEHSRTDGSVVNEGQCVAIHLAGSDAKVAISGGLITSSPCGIYMEDGKLDISGGYILSPIYTTGGNLTVTGGSISGGDISVPASICIGKPTKVDLRGGYTSGIYLCNAANMTLKDILPEGYSFYTKQQRYQPDLEVKATLIPDRSDLFGIPTEGLSLNNLLMVVKLTTPAAAPNNWYKAASTADIGPIGKDIKVNGTNYYIKTTAGLAWMAIWNSYDTKDILFKVENEYNPHYYGKHVTYHLANNLDMSVCNGENIDWNWIPISLSRADFDGHGYEIQNLRVSQNESAFIDQVYSQCTLANLRVSGTISQVDNEYNYAGYRVYAAGLVLTNWGTIVNCGFYGSISSESKSGATIGGLVAENRGAIYNSYMVGSINGKTMERSVGSRPFECNTFYLLGGLAGQNSGQIENCYHPGEPVFDNVSKEEVKSIVGELTGDENVTSVTNCYGSSVALKTLKANVDTYNRANPNADRKWSDWEIVTEYNDNYPIHKSDVLLPAGGSMTLKIEGEGLFEASYKSGDKTKVIKADTIFVGENITFTITATPKTYSKLKKITFLTAAGVEEDINIKDVVVKPEGVTFEYKLLTVPIELKAHFETKEVVTIDKDEEIGTGTSTTTIDQLKIDSSTPIEIAMNQVSVQGENATTNVTPGTEATITLNGTNALGTFTNKGTVTLQAGAKANLDKIGTTIINEGVFTDETGFLDMVDGPADLKIGDRPSAVNTLSGNTITLTVSAESTTGTLPTFAWEKLNGTDWESIVSSTPKDQRSALRAATNKVESEISVGVGQYRCRITTTKESVSSTLMTYATVRSAATPEPVPVYYAITLPVLTGAVTTPAAGNHPVEELMDFSFTLTLDADYNQSTPVVKANDQVITRDASGKYTVKNITADVTIAISGIVKNATVGNADIDPLETKVWSAHGLLYLSTEQSTRVDIFTFDGKLYKQFQSMGGEQSVGLPSGIYIIRIQDKSFKVSLR